MAVKVLDAGGDLMLSGETAEEVEAALQDHLRRGSSVITKTVQVGKTWIAACSIPTTAFDPDRTTTLSLKDLASVKPAKTPRPLEPLPQSFLPCEVQAAGWKQIITGPSQMAVAECAALFRERGGQLLGKIEPDGDVWIAIVDMAGVSQ